MAGREGMRERASDRGEVPLGPHCIAANDRITRVEMSTEQIKADVNRIENAQITNLETFREISKSLTIVNMTVQDLSSSLQSLREIIKDLKDAQDTVNKDIIILKAYEDSVADIKHKMASYDELVTEFREYKAGAKASWKTVVIVASIVSTLWASGWAIIDRIQQYAPQTTISKGDK